ncbi:GrpB family protein [Clostridium sp. D2Q-14]|uniref:GrpB family protein n=1 Tax=Anaeromonas gelatinilytica TaxID=2683194 RepID=UPI00193BE7EC|nr:GrpB family protein [Anaeromonas gelatinilytica]MBS4535736.1 GrpB family protein [Anaeromonas gelatinilytica]
MQKVVVEKYNPKWKIEFEKAKSFYEELLSSIEMKVEHVGSTSVEGLWAKPILDIDIIVGNVEDSLRAIELLTTVGYKHIGNLGVEGREVLKYDEDNSYIKWMEHHLYVCLEGNENLQNHLLLRKHLRNNKKSVELYSVLKRELADKFSDDIELYIDGKTDLITELLKTEGMNSEKLKRIESINKKDK